VCLSVATPLPFTPVYNIFEKAVGANWSCNKTIACVGKGDTCSGDFIIKNANCSVNASGTPSCCGASLYCINDKCATDNVGAACKTVADCYFKVTAGNAGICANGTCSYLGNPNDKCANNSQCALNLPCNGSLCTALSQGADCSKGGLCGFGLVCKVVGTSLTCQPLPTSGSCNNGACYPGYFCSGGNCVKIYSLASGSKCNADMQCDTGLICAANGTCITAKTSLTSCSNNANCTSGLACGCSLFSGKGYCVTPIGGLDPNINPCTSQESAYYTCLYKYNCSSTGDAPNSCSYINCYSSFKKSMSCGCSISTDLIGTCIYNQYCGGFPVWAIIVIIVVIIVLILAVVVIVFLLMKRRRQYDTL